MTLDMARRYLFLHLVQSGSEPQPPSHQVTEGTFTGIKAALKQSWQLSYI